jgi:hypothetical protein
MALTLGNPSGSYPIPTAGRNAIADGFDSAVNTGGGTAVLRLRNSTTTLVSFNLQNPAFGAASTGTITLAGTTLTNTASAGTATAVDNYEILDRGSAQIWAGAVTGSDTITSGQTVNLTSFSITFPAS